MDTKTAADFDFIGGSLCLDFTNTWGGLPADSPTQDRLTTYAALLVWAEAAQVISASEAQFLQQKAAKQPQAAQSILEGAISIRETLREIFLALTRGEKPKASELESLNQALEQAMAGATIIATADAFRLEWRKDAQALDQMIAPILRSAAALLTSNELPYLRKCANPLCRWLFVDASKNHRRQWCKTSGCGNLMRVRKHRERQKGGET